MGYPYSSFYYSLFLCSLSNDSDALVDPFINKNILKIFKNTTTITIEAYPYSIKLTSSYFKNLSLLLTECASSLKSIKIKKVTVNFGLCCSIEQLVNDQKKGFKKLNLKHEKG